MIIIPSIFIFIGFYISLYVLYFIFIFFSYFILSKLPLKNHNPITNIGIIIPAHNEELLLPRLLESIQQQDYPRQLFNIIVVADNCTDNTADVAKRNGSIVLERFDQEKKGKGYAIKWAIETTNISQHDAIFIVDADSVMCGDALYNLDNMIQEGNRIIQCYNGIGNPDDSWFTRLLDVSRTIGNQIYHPTKQRLGLSSYLMGNGMCFTTNILRKYGWDAFTVGEDWEYYAKLVESGEVIGFARDARVYHRESSSLKQATSQRMRWSSGRFAIAWKYGFRLLAKGLAEHNIVKFDAALPLIFPNPSLGINITLVGLITVLTLPVIQKELFVSWFLALGLIQLGIFIIGVFYTHNKFSKFISIFIAPAFLIWKMVIDIFSVLGIGRKKWVRTERKL